MLITVRLGEMWRVMLCEVCIFLHCYDTRIVASNLTWSVDVCAFLCVCVFLCQ